MGTVPAPNIAEIGGQIGSAPLNAYAEYQRASALKQQTALEQQQTQAASLENQQKQIQLQDQQAMNKAMQGWDGQDINQLPELMRKNGVSAASYINAQQTILARRQQLQALDKGQLDNMQAHHDAALGTLNAAEQVPDEQLSQHISDSAQQLQAQGHLQPNEAQAVIQHAQSMPPDQFRPWLDVYKKGLMGEKEQIAQEISNRDTAAKETTANAEQEKANAADWKDFPELGVSLNTKTGEQRSVSGSGGLMPQGMMQAKYVALQQKKNSGQPLDPSDAGWVKAYERMKTLVPTATFNLQNAGAGTASQPSAIAQAVASGQMKWGDVISPRTPQAVKENLLSEIKQINPNFNSGDFQIEQDVRREFTSGDAAKNLTAFGTAIEHAGQLRTATDALDNGDVRALNKIGNTLGYQFGSDRTTNFNVIKNALSGEISKVFKGGQATDAEIREVQQPFDAANSPAQLKGAIDNAVALMNSKRDALKQQYQSGMQGRPNFGSNAAAGAAGPDSFTIKAPNGKTYSFKDQQSLDNFKQKAGIQ